MPTGYTRRRALLAAGAATVSLTGCTGLLGGGGSEDTLPVPTLGADDAPVTLTVYEDFACPHCRRFSLEVFPRIRSEYVETGVVRYRHRDFPIPVDETVSWQAPSAAREVQEQVGVDAFFEYSHALFANQGSLSPTTYARLAESTSAAAADVRAAAVERQHDPTVERDRQHGIDRGVEGTPSVWVDGRRLSAYGYERVSDAIEQARTEG